MHSRDWPPIVEVPLDQGVRTGQMTGRGDGGDHACDRSRRQHLHATSRATLEENRVRAAGAEAYSADGGEVGVVLCHGFTGSPQSLRPWAEHLAAAGLSVRLPACPATAPPGRR